MLDFPFDDELIADVSRDGQTRRRIYVLDETSVILGRGSKADVEVNLPACQADQVTIRRRRGGGCAVVLDPGNAIVSTAVSVSGIGGNDRYMNRLCHWLSSGLANIGISTVKKRGISDLAIGDRKVGGTCIYRTRGLLYFSATLLVDADLGLIERYLSHPPREPNYRNGRKHLDFLTQLGPKPYPSAKALASALDDVLACPSVVA